MECKENCVKYKRWCMHIFCDNFNEVLQEIPFHIATRKIYRLIGNVITVEFYEKICQCQIRFLLRNCSFLNDISFFQY